jgi:hypothetical protein
MPADHPFVQISLAVYTIAYAVVALILLAMALPMKWVSKRPGNRAFGLRTKPTLANEEVWRLVHLRIRLPFLVGASISMGFALIISLIPSLVIGTSAYMHGVVVIIIAAIEFFWIWQIIKNTDVEVNGPKA